MFNTGTSFVSRIACRRRFLFLEKQYFKVLLPMVHAAGALFREQNIVSRKKTKWAWSGGDHCMWGNRVTVNFSWIQAEVIMWIIIIRPDCCLLSCALLQPGCVEHYTSYLFSFIVVWFPWGILSTRSQFKSASGLLWNMGVSWKVSHFRGVSGGVEALLRKISHFCCHQIR